MADKELMEALGVLRKTWEAANVARDARGPGCRDKAIATGIAEKRALRRVLKRYDEITRPRKQRTIADTLTEDEQE